MRGLHHQWRQAECEIFYLNFHRTFNSLRIQLAFRWLENPDCATYPLSHTSYPCEYVPIDSPIAIFTITVSFISVLACLAFLAAVWKYRDTPIMIAGQLVLVHTFVCGAVMMAGWSVMQLGKPTNAMCMARQWGFHLAYSVMFGPLFLKVGLCSHLPIGNLELISSTDLASLSCL